MKKMKHIPALCLCLMLLCGAACAEEMHVLGRGNWDYLEYGCTLPDGRLVLTGEKTMNRPDHVTGAWLLCLNPDLTVSWEVVDEEENGYDSVRKAVVLPDGTIAAAVDDFRNDQYVSMIKTYTQDGEATGKEAELPAGAEIVDAGPSWLMMFNWNQETGETLLLDWDGHELLRYDERKLLVRHYGYAADSTDGLVLAGFDKQDNGHAKILKLDGLTDRVLWETTMEWQLPDTEDAWFGECIQTEEGGYAALMDERGTDPDTPPYTLSSFLVKLDAEGRVLQINGESFERDNLVAYRVFCRDGRIGALCQTPGTGSRDRFRPVVFRWFDMDGNETASTEINLNLEDFPALRTYLSREEDENQPEPEFAVNSLIFTADGIWALGSCYAGTTSSDGISGKLVDSNEIIAVKVPEP